MIEKKIKRQKGLAPKNVICSKTKQTICCSVGKLEDIVNNVKTKLGISNLTSSRNYYLRKWDT